MKTMNESLLYTETEIRGFLPSGWDLIRSSANAPGTWDSKKKVYQVRVLDNVAFDWPVVVKDADVSSKGRLEALRLAMDAVYRERLG